MRQTGEASTDDVDESEVRVSFFVIFSSPPPPSPVFFGPFLRQLVLREVFFMLGGGGVHKSVLFLFLFLFFFFFFLKYDPEQCEWRSAAPLIDGDTRSINIDNLEEQTAYLFRLKSRNALGWSGWSSVRDLSTRG